MLRREIISLFIICFFCCCFLHVVNSTREIAVVKAAVLAEFNVTPKEDSFAQIIDRALENEFNETDELSDGSCDLSLDLLNVNSGRFFIIGYL